MNGTFQRTLTTEEIRRVACPLCKAPPGSGCTEPASSARRAHHHKERVTAARRLASQQRQSGVEGVIRRRVADIFYRP